MQIKKYLKYDSQVHMVLLTCSAMYLWNCYVIVNICIRVNIYDKTMHTIIAAALLEHPRPENVRVYYNKFKRK